MRLSEIPELQNYPKVSDFVEKHLSMQFGDVRSMLRLPLPKSGIEYGCNFAATAALCNLISGLSVTIFKPSKSTRTNHKSKRVWIGSGEAFKQLLKSCYPWEPGDNPTDGAKALYDLFRNPLAHALGVHSKSSYQIHIRKNPLQNRQIEKIEKSSTRPHWLSPGVSRSGTKWEVVAEGFYRDVFHMFWNLVKDNQQMTDAEQRFSNGNIIWTEGKP